MFSKFYNRLKGFSSKKSTSLLEALRKQRQEILSDAQRLKSENTFRSQAQNPATVLKTAIRSLEDIGRIAVKTFQNLTDAKTQALRDFRAFRIGNNIDRLPRVPDRWFTAIKVGCSTLLDSIGSTVLFIAGGMMDVPAAAATGFALAITSTMASMTTGYFPGRYINAPQTYRHSQFIRFVSGVALGFCITGIATLQLAAARMRATGSHEDIWNWEALSFWGTFSDGFSISIFVVGICAAAISIYSGRHGLSDCIPGYEQVFKDAEHAINQAAEQIHDDTLNDCEEIHEDARDEIESICDQSSQFAHKAEEQYLTLNNRIIGFNNDIDTALDQVCADHDALQKRLEYIKQKSTKTPAPNFQAFKNLRMEEIAISNEQTEPEPFDPAPLIAQLEAAYSQVMSEIREAYLQFQTHNTPFNLDD